MVTGIRYPDIPEMKIENEIRINTHNKKMNKNRRFLNKNELENNMLG